MSKIFLQQTAQQILNLVEALDFYKNNVVRPKYRNLIEQQLKEIGAQLNLQEINIFLENNTPKFNFGQLVKYEDKDAIIIGTSDEDGFIKIAIYNDNFEFIDVPIVLLERQDK